MFVFLLLMIGANLLIGFCAAVRVRQLIQSQPSIVSIENAEVYLPDVEISPADLDGPIRPRHSQVPRPAPEEVIPPEYLHLLEAEAVETQSLVEASAQVLRLEIGRYREKLITIENNLRDAWYQPSEEVLHEILEALETVNLEWLDKQAEAAQHLDASADELQQYTDVGRRLCDTLFEQTAQIETTLSNLQQLDFDDGLGDICRKLVLEIGRLMDLAHDLRDKMTETVVTILRAEKRLTALERPLKIDNLTLLLNRTGLDCHFFEWWRDDIRRERALSVGLVDIDGFRRFNERLGTEIGDELISTVGRYLHDLMHSKRVCELAMRLDGQRFLLFFGDNGPRAATSAVERIRQTIAATSFDFEGEEIDIRITSGVVEARPDDTVPKLLARAMTAMKTAKRNGRDRTFIDEGYGPQPIDPPLYQVRSRIVRVGQ